MTYLLNDQMKDLDVYVMTYSDGPYRNGGRYRDTKDYDINIVSSLIENDLRNAVRNRTLPKMKFRTKQSVLRKSPFIEVTILNVNEVVVHRNLEKCCFLESVDIQPIDVLFPIELTDIGQYIHDKILQIVWRYNSDTPWFDGHPGVRFLYQIKFDSVLVQKQIKAFDQAVIAEMRKRRGEWLENSEH